MHIVDIFFQLMACFFPLYFSFIYFTVSIDVQTSYYQYCQNYCSFNLHLTLYLGWAGFLLL